MRKLGPWYRQPFCLPARHRWANRADPAAGVTRSASGRTALGKKKVPVASSTIIKYRGRGGEIGNALHMISTTTSPPSPHAFSQTSHPSGDNVKSLRCQRSQEGAEILVENIWRWRSGRDATMEQVAIRAIGTIESHTTLQTCDASAPEVCQPGAGCHSHGQLTAGARCQYKVGEEYCKQI